MKVALFEERFIGVARTGHPALTGGGLDPSGWAGCAHALVSVRRDATGVLDRDLAALGLTRRIALVAPHMAAIAATIALTDLVSALPARLAASLDPRLTTFELPVPSPTWQVDMLWSPKARRDQANVWLRRLVSDVAGTL